MESRPPYAIQSVDHALQIIHMLRDTGLVRVVDVSRSLGVATSTAHRLLSMLVYRGFAIQEDSRAYRPGPAMTAPADAGVFELREVMLPHIRRLSALVDESVNLSVRVGVTTRFIEGVEGRQLLRIGDRRGVVLPAAYTSGGRALLATLPPTEVRALYTGSDLPEPDLTRLGRVLATVRRVGYAVNNQETEAGVCAIGAAVHDLSGRARGALSIALPSVRFTKAKLPGLAAQLLEQAEQAGRELSRA